MTSKHPSPNHRRIRPIVCLTLVMSVIVTAPGCQSISELFEKPHTRSVSPYPQRQTWAVAPLRNESGSRFADSEALADDLSRQLTLIHGLNAVPVNRVLAAMDSLKMPTVRSRKDALELLKALDVDGLVVGSVSAWNPYDPPKIGLAVDLYLNPGHPSRKLDTRRLTQAATEGEVKPGGPYKIAEQPLSSVSAFFDAADPITREKLKTYARDRGFANDDEHPVRLYRLSMDLYSQFASHEITRQLLTAERIRLSPPQSRSSPTANQKPDDAS